MRSLLIVVISFFIITGIPLSTTFAEKNSQLSIGDAATVDDAVAHITAILERQGLEVVRIIDHAQAANSVGLELAPTQVIFARPPQFFERRLLQRSDTVGIDIPIKFLVFEDRDGIQVTNNSAGYLFDRHDFKTYDWLIWYLEHKAEQFGETPNGLITIESWRSFEETVERLQAAISSNQAFRIPLVLDYGIDRGRDRIDRDRRWPVLIVFGNPNAGTPLMQADQRTGIDLPQKMLIWEDRNGGVNITYNDPFFIASRHDVLNQDQNERLKAIAGALRRFALFAADRELELEN